MFPNYSSNYRHAPFPTNRLSAALISRPSIGTMGLLRLPSSFSFLLVALVQDTACACCLFLSLLQRQQVPCITRSIGHAADLVPQSSCGDVRLSRVPVYPHSVFDMFSDPDQTSASRLIDALVLSQLKRQLRLRY
jgi:hypothetical protein